MRIYTKAGDLAFSQFIFPDGQPHFKLETYEREFNSATVEMAIKSPVELFTLQLVVDVLRGAGYSEINLDVRYLMAARMDRAIDSLSPFTLSVVARILNSCGFSRVRLLDVHSETATRLIRNSENKLPYHVVSQVIRTVGPVNIIIPDKGAEVRVFRLMDVIGNQPYILCGKKRDMTTGKLSGFEILSKVNPIDAPALIVDDICDGGGTFTGLAKVLREAGAKKVYLYVTHGIFSKGLPLEGIDRVFTTDSYNPVNLYSNCGLVQIPISMRDMK